LISRWTINATLLPPDVAQADIRSLPASFIGRWNDAPARIYGDAQAAAVDRHSRRLGRN